MHNLAFGLLLEGDKINDEARIHHDNHSKVFSTIMLAALLFLAENKEKYLGVDGSNNARAYMYYRCIQNNFDYLSKFFNIYGVNYYIRVLRKINDEDDDHPFNNSDLIAIPQKIEKNTSVRADELYNYFIFNTKKDE